MFFFSIMVWWTDERRLDIVAVDLKFDDEW